MSQTEIMEIGMECVSALYERLGFVGAQRFFADLIGQGFDYTAWHEEHAGENDADALLENAAAYAKAHPFHSARME